MRFEVHGHDSHKFLISAHSFVAVGTGMDHEEALPVITVSHCSGSL
jgi:hypothetical protein